MKAVLSISVVLGLPATSVMAECAGHTKVQASLPIDRQQTTASISTAAVPQDQAMLAKPRDTRTDQPVTTE